MRIFVFLLLVFMPYSSFGETKSKSKDIKYMVAYADTLRSAVNVGKNMAKLRKSGSNEDYKKCIEIMSKMRPKVDALYADADRLPPHESNYILGVAAYNTSMCVTCAPNALTYCNEADKNIREGLSELKGQ